MPGLPVWPSLVREHHDIPRVHAEALGNPRTAMELMRHSDIRLTTNIYQHLELVDTAGAVNRLPVVEAETEARAQGTDGATA